MNDLTVEMMVVMGDTVTVALEDADVHDNTMEPLGQTMVDASPSESKSLF
jgi:hypothetical protein